MHGNGSVPEHGLWTGGRHYYLVIWPIASNQQGITLIWEFAKPEFSMGYAKDVMTPNSNFSLGS